jgi:hypothetical protein
MAEIHRSGTPATRGFHSDLYKQKMPCVRLAIRVSSNIAS